MLMNLSRFTWLLLCAALAGCATGGPPSSMTPETSDASRAREQIRKGLNTLISEPYAETQTVEVYYATNRAPVGTEGGCGDQAFGVNVGTAASFGICRINSPKRHPVGLIEPASNPRADPHRYFRELSHTALNEQTFAEAIRKKDPVNILIFVHGFNVKFQEAVLRAAQIAYDLKFQGLVVLFSWPAGAGPGFLDSTLINRTYQANKANAASSVAAMGGVFKTLASMGLPLSVMVHSMGHQVVLPGLVAAGQEVHEPFIDELILNAPDFPIEEFTRIAPDVHKLSKRITVYCSFNDNAIAASETYNKGRRMGACERVEGVDVINVGEIDAPAMGVAGLGHGYYASRPILGDVFQVLLGIEAERRLFVRKSEPNSVENFYLRP